MRKCEVNLHLITPLHLLLLFYTYEILFRTQLELLTQKQLFSKQGKNRTEILSVWQVSLKHQTKVVF